MDFNTEYYYIVGYNQNEIADVHEATSQADAYSAFLDMKANGLDVTIYDKDERVIINSKKEFNFE